MANGYGYEFMDLGNPSALGEPLSRGGGRIAFPSGQVQDYQFNPPSIEDKNEALRAAAARMNEFDIQKREAEEMRALMDDLLQSGKVDDASKVVEQASKFQSIRKFDRNFREAKQRGMDDTTATIYAAQRNLPMLTSSAQGNVINAARQPSEFTSSTGESFAISPTGTWNRLSDPNAVPRPVDLGSGRQGAVFDGKLYPLPTSDKTATPYQQANYWSQQEDKLTDINRRTPANTNEVQNAIARRKFFEAQMGGAVPQGTGASGPINPLPKSKADLEIDKLYEMPNGEGVGRWNGNRFIAVEAK